MQRNDLIYQAYYCWIEKESCWVNTLPHTTKKTSNWYFCWKLWITIFLLNLLFNCKNRHSEQQMSVPLLQCVLLYSCSYTTRDHLANKITLRGCQRRSLLFACNVYALNCTLQLRTNSLSRGHNVAVVVGETGTESTLLGVVKRRRTAPNSERSIILQERTIIFRIFGQLPHSPFPPLHVYMIIYHWSAPQGFLLAWLAHASRVITLAAHRMNSSGNTPSYMITHCVAHSCLSSLHVTLKSCA